MLAAHPVLLMKNSENSLELWRVANWPDKTGLVQSLVHPFSLFKWGQLQGEQVSSLIDHAHFPTCQGKGSGSFTSPRKIYVVGKINKASNHSGTALFTEGKSTWEADTPAIIVMLTPQCLRRKLQSIDACNSKWGSSSLQGFKIQWVYA